MCLYLVVLSLLALCSITSTASGYTQTIGGGSNLNAVSCVPSTTNCVVSEANGSAFYATNVSATLEGTWNAWPGPKNSKGEPETPNEAVACPASTVCLVVDGKNKEKTAGGNMYYATTLDGTWSEGLKQTYGVLAASCPSSSFCVAAQARGRISYSESPASKTWSEVKLSETITETVTGVSCLSSSFCAAVNKGGTLYVANTTEKALKEPSGWKATPNIDSSSEVHGIACSSTSSCLAIDGEGHVLDLTINGSGEATVSKEDLDGANDLTAITCVGTTCVAVDNQGNIFVSTNAGTSWSDEYFVFGIKLTGVSCASSSLCLAAGTSGSVTTFDPASAPADYKQSIDSGNGLNAVSCIASSTECVVSDTKGNTYYATNISTSAKGTWTTWNGPTGQSPSQAVDCPTSTLCVLADGKAEDGGGGKLYYATSLGGTWKQAFSPAFGVDSISCASASLCISGQAEGFIHFSTKPASTEWLALEIVEFEVVTMNAVDCLTASFCAIADSDGSVHIANTEAKVKEVAGWKSTDVDGSTSLQGISCTSATSCVAVDSAGDVLDLTIESSGSVKATKHNIDGTNSLTAISCTGSSTCAAVDNIGDIFVTNNKGETWVREHQLEDKLTSVSCASTSLCLAGDTTGNVTAFDTR